MIGSQGHEQFPECNMASSREIQLLGHFFQDKEILKEEPINFCKLYDNEGNTQLPWRSNHFINPTV